MKWVAFFRNVNLGQGKSPSRVQFEEAFSRAGAGFARSFQTNGTLIFSVGELSADLILEQACQTLEAISGLQEPAFISRLKHLADLVAGNPFAGFDPPDDYRYSATFMLPASLARLAAPLWSPRKDLEVVRVTGEVVLSVSHLVNERFGDPTSFLEKYLQAKVTTRAWSTISRLVKKFA
jgi:uncharacterized protein (DUF1697 family)